MANYKVGDIVAIKTKDQLLESGWTYNKLGNFYSNYWHIIRENMFHLLGTSFSIFYIDYIENKRDYDTRLEKVYSPIDYSVSKTWNITEDMIEGFYEEENSFNVEDKIKLIELRLDNIEHSLELLNKTPDPKDEGKEKLFTKEEVIDLVERSGKEIQLALPFRKEGYNNDEFLTILITLVASKIIKGK